MNCNDKPRWRTASACDGGACVQVMAVPGAVLVRDRGSRMLAFPPGAWTAFTAGLKQAGG